MRTLTEITDSIRMAMSVSSAKELFALADEAGLHPTAEAQSLSEHARGTAYRLTGDYTRALRCIEHAAAFCEEIGDRAGVARMANAIGNTHQLTGDYPKAQQSFEQALDACSELRDDAAVAVITSNIGLILQTTGDFPRALETYERSLALLQGAGDVAGVARVTGNIGNVYLGTEDFQQALQWFERALSLHTELGDNVAVARVTGNIGLVHHAAGDQSAALDCFERARSLYHELDDQAGIVRCTGSIVEALIGLDDTEAALTELNKQADLPIIDPTVRVVHHTHRAQLSERSGDVEEAQSELAQALQIAGEAGLKNEASELHRRLRDLSQHRNAFEDYIYHNTEFLRIREEVRGKEATQKLAMIEAERKMEGERRERDKERALLYGALPESVANRMLAGEDVSGDHYDSAAVLFLDIVGFTTHSSAMRPTETIVLLERIFTHFDRICEEHGVTKVKTIGDSYLAFAGTHPSVVDAEGASHPERGEADEGPHETAAQRVAAVALAMQSAEFTWPMAVSNSNRIQFRIGLHSGPVVAGVIGTQRLQYDIWGDTVNTASRMESTGEPGKIQVSEAFVGSLTSFRDDAAPPLTLERGASEGGGVRFWTTERGEVSVKGKGTMKTYWLEEGR